MFVFYGYLIFNLAVLVHEFGHYLAARLCGVGVTVIAIGFNRTLWRYTFKSGMEFRINMIPFGGYCEMKSVQTVAPYVDEKDGTEYYDDDLIEFAGLGRQIIIFLAGIMFNVILATVILLVLNFTTHTYQTNALWLVRDMGPTGKMLISALYSPFATMVSVPYEFFVMVTTKLQELMASAGGPVTIVMMSKPAATAVTLMDQVVSYAYFAVSMNMVLAGFNLIPLVPLDGGQVVNLIIQKMFGRTVSIVFSVITVIMITALFVVAFKNDGVNLYRALGPVAGGIVLSTIAGLVTYATVRFVGKHRHEIMDFVRPIVNWLRAKTGSSGQAQG